MPANQTTLVLIHGHGVDASIWDSVYAELVLEALVMKPDFSRFDRNTTIEAYADELYAQLESAAVGPVILVGHSMGGYIALAFAEQHPERVQGLILYHSTATADDDNRREKRWQAIAELNATGSGPFIQQQLPKMVAPSYPPDKTQVLIDRFQDVPADALSAGMKAMANRPDRTHVLRQASFPILLVLGRDDQILPYEQTAKLADLSPKISVAAIENAGHLSMVEQPDMALSVIRSFVDQR